MEKFYFVTICILKKETTIKPAIQEIFIFSLFVQGEFPNQYQARQQSSQTFDVFDFFIAILIKYNKPPKAVKLSLFPVICHRLLYSSTPGGLHILS
jgi:hypothetical protein